VKKCFLATTYFVLRQCTSFYFVCFTRIGNFTWRVSDCEELSGDYSGDDGVDGEILLGG
jgi:hypothetical protein